MIGLPDKKVVLVPYDEDWSLEAQRIIRKLHEVLNNEIIDAQPMGSTSVRGIVAKPLIDIACGVRFIPAIKTKLDLLQANGFIFRPRTETKGHLLFAVRDQLRQVDTHYIHVVVFESTEWREYLYFRDTLNQDESLRKEYQRLKVDLAHRFPDDRTSYTQGKNDFIRQVLEGMDRQ